MKERYNEGTDLRSELSATVERKKALQQKLSALEQPFRQYEEYEKRKEKLDILQKKRVWAVRNFTLYNFQEIVYTFLIAGIRNKSGTGGTFEARLGQNDRGAQSTRGTSQAIA